VQTDNASIEATRRDPSKEQRTVVTPAPAPDAPP
jgi:hypothetical protein